MIKYANIGLLEVAGEDSVTITGADGWDIITIYARGQGNTIITGLTTRTIGGRACSSVTLNPGEEMKFGDKGQTISSLTIAVEADGQALIKGESFPNII